jgi:hypothetical protein
MTSRIAPGHAVAAASLVLVGVVAYAYAHRHDADVHVPPEYDTFRPPAAGAAYVDPVFGTSIRRLSDAPRTPSAAGPGMLRFVTNEYSSMSPFNADSTRLLLIHQSYFALYDGEGGFLKDLPFEIHAASEPRWSRRDPGLLYYVVANQLKQYDTVRNVSAVVNTFPEYTSIAGMGESDICFDGDHLVLTGDKREIFVYELPSRRKGGVLATGGRGFDQIYITPDDHVLVGWEQPGSGRYSGVELFDRNMNFLRSVARVVGHMDVTRDVDGSEVVVWANAADPLPVCRNGVVKIRLADAQQTCLLSLDWSLALHVSGTDRAWVFVETYAPANPDPYGGAWPAYTNEIMQIRVDGSEVRRLAHHRSRPFDRYNYTPRVSTNREGTRVVFSSNFGLQAVLPYPDTYTDVYLMAIPNEVAR